jgi:hypothetical protein
MNKARFILLSFCLMIGPGTAWSIDRTALHESRFQGQDLTARRLAGEHADRLRDQAGLFAEVPVSWSIRPARFSQDNACLVSLSDGGWLVVWDDNRRGARKIFGQRYNQAFNPVGQNEILAGSAVGTNYRDARICADTLGRVYLYYRDQTRGLVFGSRFNPDLTVDLSEFLVNDTTSAAYAGPYDIAVFPDGRAVIVWENYDLTGSTIQMRVYNAAGASVTGPDAVNTDGGGTQHWVPSVAVQAGSGFLVTWEDYRNGQADVYARQFQADGTPLAAEFAIVPPPNDDAAQYEPQTVFSDSDGYLISWIDLRSGQEIYGQLYDPVTGLVGGNFLISAGDPQISNWNLSLTASKESRLLATWSTSGGDNSIVGLQYAPGLTQPYGLAVMNLEVTGERSTPSAYFRSAEEFGLVWTEIQDGDGDIRFMTFDTSELRLFSPELQVNDDDRGAPSTSPFVIRATEWYDLIVWADKRNDAGDIYVVPLSNAGSAARGNIRVNQDTTADLQSEPSAAVSGTRSLIVWIDSRALAGVPGQRIYGRFGSLLADFSDNEFLISDTNQAAIKGSPRAAMLTGGQGLVAWSDRRSGSYQVWGRWLTDTGSLDGGEFAVSSPATDSINTDIQMGVDDAQQFYVVWHDKNPASPSIKGKIYHSNKSQAGSFTWTSSLSGVAIDDIAADITTAGEIAVLFTGVDAGIRKAFFVRLASDGSELTAPIEITDNPSADASHPAIAVGNNDYISTAWVDRRDGIRRVYYQLLDPSLVSLGINEPISTVIPEFMEAPHTDAGRGRAWFVWADPRQDGLNIYASNLVYDPTDVDQPGGDNLPMGLDLAQNYPNPFNPSTIIRFSLPRAIDLTLAIYNVLGQEVTVLAEGHYPAGNHAVTWDGTNGQGEPVAGGLYLYRLESTEFSTTRKMILLK